MTFKELLSKLHPTQKLRWERGGDITGKEFTVNELKKWDDKGLFSLVKGELTLAQDGNKIFIIQHDHEFNLQDYPHSVKEDVVIFTGVLEYI